MIAEAEGPIEQLENLVNWCKNGPENAHVLEVRVSEMELENSCGFVIRR